MEIKCLITGEVRLFDESEPTKVDSQKKVMIIRVTTGYSRFVYALPPRFVRITNAGLVHL